MRKIKWTMSNGLANAEIGGEIEVEDDMSEEDINDLIVDEVWQHIDIWWE